MRSAKSDANMVAVPRYCDILEYRMDATLVPAIANKPMAANNTEISTSISEAPRVRFRPRPEPLQFNML
jgi:hypothetical protein